MKEEASLRTKSAKLNKHLICLTSKEKAQSIPNVIIYEKLELKSVMASQGFETKNQTLYLAISDL